MYLWNGTGMRLSQIFKISIPLLSDSSILIHSTFHLRFIPIPFLSCIPGSNLDSSQFLPWVTCQLSSKILSRSNSIVHPDTFQVLYQFHFRVPSQFDSRTYFPCSAVPSKIYTNSISDSILVPTIWIWKCTLWFFLGSMPQSILDSSHFLRSFAGPISARSQSYFNSISVFHSSSI